MAWEGNYSKRSERMRKIFVLFIGLIGLGVVMSGCVANGFRTTKVKDAYIQKNYINKVKVPKSKKVGDRNIKFYVGKVVDKREDRYVMRKPIYGFSIAAKVRLENSTLTIKNITKKALYNTGWGVVDNESSADFVVDTTLKTMHLSQRLLDLRYKTKANLCILKRNNKVIMIKGNVNLIVSPPPF